MVPDTSVPKSSENGDKVANLSVVSYQKLLSKDFAEAQILLHSCTEQGFFYLDLGSVDMKGYLKLKDSLFDVAKEYFSRSLEEKLQDSRDEIGVFNICGYKPMGLDNGNIENKKDGCEGLRESFLPYFMNRVNNGIQVPADLRFCPTSDTNLRPIDGLKEEWNLFMDFIDQSHFICHTMLQSISDAIGLRGRERLEVSHDQNSPSTSAAVLQHYPLQGLPPNTSAGHFAHTDSGSISVLFCSDWGLQVYSSQDSQWEWVQPRENHAVVNVGDALKFISGCKLTSSLHRVVPRHMFWVSEPRYSTIFFLRPNNDAEFTDNEGNHWTGSRWLNRKFGNYRKPHSEQMMNSLATGRFGFVGLLSSTKGVSSHV